MYEPDSLRESADGQHQRKDIRYRKVVLLVAVPETPNPESDLERASVALTVDSGIKLLSARAEHTKYRTDMSDKKETSDNDKIDAVFQIGDIVRFAPRHHAAGDVGVVVGVERWLNDNVAVAWDGKGEEPVYEGAFSTPAPERYLIKLTHLNKDVADNNGSLLHRWRERCLAQPHDYPFCFARDLELVSRGSADKDKQHPD